MVNGSGSCGGYRIEILDHAVPVRLIGPDGCAHRQLSRALSLLCDRHAPGRRTGRRYVSLFVAFLNDVDVKAPDPAERFVANVAACRRTVDLFLKINSVGSRDRKDGSMWLTPKPADHSRIASTLISIGRVTAALAEEVYGGLDPAKVDPEFSRIARMPRITVDRHGGYRRDTDRRWRLGADPNLLPRLDDPHVFERWLQGLERIYAPPVFPTMLTTIRHSGMRSFQALGLTLFDAFCSGRAGTLLVPNKGDADRERSLAKKLPSIHWDQLMAYVDGERARITGVSSRDIRMMARDKRRCNELDAMPLFTENGLDPIKYDRLYRVTRKAAEVMDLTFGDEGGDGGRKRFAGLHLLRHEYVYERLAVIESLHPNRRPGATRELIQYMGWRGEAMLKWYSMHFRIGSIGRAAAEHNDRLTGRVAGLTDHIDGVEWDEGAARRRRILAEI